MAEALTHFGAIAPDSGHFFDASAYFRGIHGPPSNPVGIVRPLLPLLTALLAPTPSVLPTVYALINLALYPLSGLLCYELTRRIAGSETVSLVSSLMLLTSFTMITYGAAAYYMGATIFFEFLVALMALSVDKRGLLDSLWKGLLSGVGALSGEAALIYAGFGFLRRALGYRRLDGALIYLITSLIIPLAIPTILGYNLIDFYMNYNIGYARALGLLKPWYWLGVRRLTLLAAGLSILDVMGLVIGFLAEKDEERLRLFYLMFSLALIAWLSWVPSERRHVYILYPAVQWMSALGVHWMALQLSKKPLLRTLNAKGWLAVMIAMNAALNNVLAYLWYLGGNLRTLGPIPGLSVPSPALHAYHSLSRERGMLIASI